MGSKNQDKPTNSNAFNAIFHQHLSTGEPNGQLSDKSYRLFGNTQSRDVAIMNTKAGFICERKFCREENYDWVCFHGRGYSFVKTMKTGRDAHNFCKEMNGTPVVIDNKKLVISFC